MSLTSQPEKKSITKTVDPSERNFRTGIIVTAGERYAFHAEGEWIDWFKKCGPDGWGCGYPLVVLNRVRSKPFFLLCGNVGKDDRFTFVIGKCAEWTVPPDVNSLPDRQLYLFANDWPWMYWNNKMHPDEDKRLKVTITLLE